MTAQKKNILINILVSVVVTVAVSYFYHSWWYGNVVDELQRACDPYGREFGIQPAKNPKTIGAVLRPYMSVFRAIGDFGPDAPSSPPAVPPGS